MKRALLLLVVSCLSWCCVAVAGEWEDVEVSVLTCSPGDEVYSLYGHTAVRVRDCGNPQNDVVFNYGVFDFNSEGFMWRFVFGQTDYICQAVPTAFFLGEYAQRGSEVRAQVLNLSRDEARMCLVLLQENVRPENMTYRYNYLTSNCTTKVMDLVERVVDGVIGYTPDLTETTYRQIMHEYTVTSPWAQEGNDVLLGAEVDTLLSERAKSFVPERYSRALSEAVVHRLDDDTRSLVRSTEVLVAGREGTVSQGFPLHPHAVGWGVFVAFLLIAALEYRLGRIFVLLDVCLMLVHGLVGALLLFVFLFSEHPTLDSNFLVWVLNPLPLVALRYVVVGAWRKYPSVWHYVMIVLMASFLLFMPWVPQRMCMLTVPVTLALLSRYVLHLSVIKKLERSAISSEQ